MKVIINNVFNDSVSEAEVYENVATFQATNGKAYLMFVTTLYASGRPVGIRAVNENDSVIVKAESSDPSLVRFMYQYYNGDGIQRTIRVQDKRATTGRHTGTIIVIEF